MSKYKVGDKFTVTVKSVVRGKESDFYKLEGLGELQFSDKDLDNIWDSEPDDFEKGYKAGMKVMLDRIIKAGNAQMNFEKEKEKHFNNKMNNDLKKFASTEETDSDDIICLILRNWFDPFL